MWRLRTPHNLVALGLTILILSLVVITGTSKFITKISASFPQNTFMSFVRASRFPENYIVAFLVTVAAMADCICFYSSHELPLSLHRCLYHSRNYEWTVIICRFVAKITSTCPIIWRYCYNLVRNLTLSSLGLWRYGCIYGDSKYNHISVWKW